MQDIKNIIDCYDKTAENYAEKFYDELINKHLDRILLNSFASENKNRGTLIDLGCGPGQTTKYLFDCGMTDILGTDISVNMIKAAKKINPHINFETADMLKLKYADKSFGSAIAFYSIVHFDIDHVKKAFSEINRTLKDNGQLLISFHAGAETVHMDNFLDHTVNIDFHSFETAKISELLTETGFEILDVIERHPYKDAEYPSRRAYIRSEKI
ncbi:MAG TPA: methyltransferase domain-containing protein [Ignavibacteria bacterium]|mgnify:CR=1 FL=1|nr:class I SAM-dependent methyltransferase [Bacteroidota bacterium]HRI86274.1 methyltransferase domain-containing protein [Ignavibacteria bacterium]HRK00986.1 methyltransferase domain-containing protein [Ignavibacteria bacterium]